VERTDGDVVEQAEAHRHRGLGMVPRRAHGAEGVARLARHHGIHRGDDGASRAQRGLARSRAQRRVGVERMPAGGRHRAHHALHVGLRVDQHQAMVLGARRLAALERAEGRRRQGREHRLEALRALRVRRCGRSGCQAPGSWSRQAGCVSSSVVILSSGAGAGRA